MPHVQITRPAPDGSANSILVDGVELNEALSGATVHVTGPSAQVALFRDFIEDVSLCLDDAEIVIDPRLEAVLEKLGWTRPGASA